MQSAPGSPNKVRAEWCNHLTAIVTPPLEAMANGRLRKTMPRECAEGREEYCATVCHLEILGRSLAGIAPWLALNQVPENEAPAQQRLQQWSRDAITQGLDPQSPDTLQFDHTRQTIVDAAFLAHALLRAPNELFATLDAATQNRLIGALRTSRQFKPHDCNWLLFSAIIETALFRFTGDCQDEVIDYAITRHEQWYLGDGTYGDGPELHHDYYNSYVIQPMLLDILETVATRNASWAELLPKVSARAVRYAAVQERMIATDGSYPPLGRSIAYRGGAFQLLSQMALRKELPSEISPAQVRGALTAVMHRTLDAPNTFDANGWLQIGLAGHQPGLGEGYINTGSLYLCSTLFLPLGLPAEASFWSQPNQPWTSVKLWGGQDAPADHALGPDS